MVATDINPAACRNARHNARKLGFEGLFDVREVSMERPGAFEVVRPDEKFDLIVTDPPFRNFRPRKMREYALGDENYALLKSILSGARDHLTETGRLLLSRVPGGHSPPSSWRGYCLEGRILCPPRPAASWGLHPGGFHMVESPNAEGPISPQVAGPHPPASPCPGP